MEYPHRESGHRSRRLRAAWCAALVLALSGTLSAQDGVVVRNGDVLRSEFEVDYATPAPLAPVEIVGAPNGVFSGKVLLVSREPIRGVVATMGDLARRAGGKIPAAAVDVRYGLPADDLVMDFDALGSSPPAQMPVLDRRLFGRLWPASGPAMGWAVQPVWVIVRVPTDAAAGDYEGTLSVSAEAADVAHPPSGAAVPSSEKQPSHPGAGVPHKKQRFAVPVKVKVSAWKLPAPRDFRTFAEIIESPESVAMQYDAPIGSDRHFALVEKSLALMGELGNKTAYVPLIAETNMGNSESMVRWIRKPDGSYTFDFRVMDRILDLVEKHQGKPKFLVLYVWDAFLEGGMNEDVLRHEPTATREERSSLQGQGPTVTQVDPATGKTQPLVLPQYSDRAKSLALWKPLAAELLARLKKRGLDRSLALGIVTDVQPAPAVVEHMKELFPAVPWMRRGHMRIRDVAGVTLSLQEGPSYNTWAYNSPPPKRLYGWQPPKWQFPGLSVHFPRDFRDYFSRCRWRMLGEVNIAGAQCGFGGLGADFWRVMKDKRGRSVGRISEGRYPKSNWRNLNIATTLLASGPDGAIPTVRFLLLREGLQECEARIAVEEAILSGKLSRDRAARLQTLLDDRIRALIDGMGDKWAYGGHWETQKFEYPAFVEGGWQERSKKLFDAAAEITERKEANQPPMNADGRR